jgi:hypothetical protein
MTTPQVWIALLSSYERPCFVCGRSGVCAHREPAVERAYLLAPSTPRKEPQAETAAARAAVAIVRVNGASA